MKKIVITGASGVVGRSVLEAAEKEGLAVAALTRGAVQDPFWHTTDYSQQDLEKVMAGADAIIHLAGTKGDKTEIEDFDSDYEMAVNILNAAKTCNIGRIIYSSSRLIYADPDKIPWTENTLPAPKTAYGINKIRIEKLCREWSEQNRTSATVVRIAQVLSENDHMRNMVNVFRDLARDGRQLKVLGRSVARRQYIYVSDLAKIMLRLCNDENTGFRIVNAGMQQAYTNREIAEAFNKAYGNTLPVEYDDSQPETITSSIMDVGKMIELTGIIPMDLGDALAHMANKDLK